MEFPFQDTPNTACLVCRHVLDGESPISYISHDKDDGTWQFLCSKSHREGDARVISLFSAFKLDESIGQVAGLPRGCFVERNSKSGSWE